MDGRNFRLGRRGILLLIATLWLVMGAQSNMALSCQRAWGGAVNASLNQPFQLRVQEQAAIASTDLMVKFLGVSEDSRCPSGVQCMWAGQVSFTLEVSTGGSTESIAVTEGAGSSESTIPVDGYQIRLDEVAPYPSIQSPIEDDDYVVTLTVLPVAPEDL